MLGVLKTPSVSEKLGAPRHGMIGPGGETVRARGSCFESICRLLFSIAALKNPIFATNRWMRGTHMDDASRLRKGHRSGVGSSSCTLSSCPRMTLPRETLPDTAVQPGLVLLVRLVGEG